MGLWERVGEKIENLVDDLGGDAELRKLISDARTHLNNGDPQGAEQLLTGHAATQASARAMTLLGLSQLRQSKFEQARATLDVAVAARPDDLLSRLTLAEAQLAAGDGDAALASCHILLRSGRTDRPTQAQIHGLAGKAWFAKGDAGRATRELRKALAASPARDLGLTGLLGRAFLQQGNLTAARQQLESAASAVPADGDVLESLVQTLLQLECPTEARLAALRLIEAEPRRASGHRLLAMTALALGEPSSARDTLVRASDLTPHQAQLHQLLARAHSAVGDVAPALDQLSLGYRLASQTELPDLLRDSLTLLLAGPGVAESPLLDAYLARLRAEATQLLDLVPDDPLGLAASAVAVAAANPSQARELAERSAASGEHYSNRLARGVALLAANASLEAAGNLRRALRLDPHAGLARHYLHLTHQQLAGEAAEQTTARQQPIGSDTQAPSELHPALLRAERLLSAQPAWQQLARGASQLLQDYDHPLLVAVMGEFNSGKSTFVNALIGETIAPMGVTPTTATINVLKYGNEKRARVIWRDDHEQELPWDQLASFLRSLGQQRSSAVRLVELLLPAEQLLRVNVVDTPGLNALIPPHEATARELLARADAVIWLFSAGQAGKQSEQTALNWIRQLKLKTLGVINKIDRHSASEIEQVIGHIQQEFGELLDAICPVSAKDALLARQQDLPDLLEGSRFPQLRMLLDQRLFARARRLKRDVTRARALELTDQARAQLEQQTERCVAFQARAGELIRRESQPFCRLAAAERGKLLLAADAIYRRAASEVLDFVQPRRWALGEHRSEPADRDFLIDLLEDEMQSACAASRERLASALDHVRSSWSAQLDRTELADVVFPGASSHGLPPRVHDLIEARRALLDQQVYGRFGAFVRGYLRGGWVDRFFEQHLPQLELQDEPVYRAFIDQPIELDADLLAPLGVWATQTDQQLRRLIDEALQDALLDRWEIERCLLEPLSALRSELASAAPPSPAMLELE